MNKPKNSRALRIRNMEAWITKRAKKAPTDTVLFFRLFVQRGCDLQTARDLAMAKDGTSWS